MSKGEGEVKEGGEGGKVKNQKRAIQPTWLISYIGSPGGGGEWEVPEGRKLNVLSLIFT